MLLALLVNNRSRMNLILTYMYNPAVALRDTMIELEVAIEGGKDSLSMAAQAGGETVKAPGNLVISRILERKLFFCTLLLGLAKTFPLHEPDTLSISMAGAIATEVGDETAEPLESETDQATESAVKDVFTTLSFRDA
ncbi:hypothetical protein SELMODRAFT_430331 [Selaginella moellendorffii]|uniref:Uncharacterized protein n=1 Tax=Selaginella moellendorffii TaxID=88036 RepID=D8T926_SELML|nr:hypothetical protein SELMODRAFT_430331 [Selaginella moellendorffii]